MTDSRMADQPPQQPKWVWLSSHKSVAQGIPSVTAIAETVLAVAVYWWLAIRFGTYGFLILGACIAPLILMRSDQSVALGVKWFTNWEERLDTGGNRDPSRYERAITMAACLIALVGTVAAFYVLTSRYLIGAGGFIAFIGGFVTVMAAQILATTIAIALMSLMPSVPTQSKISGLAAGGLAGAATAVMMWLIAQWWAVPGPRQLSHW
jgi:hypothetical protein